MTDIIQRLRDQLPLGATITEDDHTIIFRVPGQRPILFNALKVTIKELENTAYQIIEMAKAVSFEREENEVK